MKNQLLLYLLLVLITACSSVKRSSSTTPITEAPARPAAASKNAPVFIENISINGSNTANESNRSTRSIAVVNRESNVNNSDVDKSESISTLRFKYSILLDVPVEELSNDKLIEFINTWYGTPYHYGGCDLNGVDCSGFAQAFMLAMYGIQLPRTSLDQYRQSKRIKKTNLAEGDLVFFNTLGKKSGISHVGVYLTNHKFIHASTNNGVMISDMHDPYYSSHYTGSGRYDIDKTQLAGGKY